MELRLDVEDLLCVDSIACARAKVILRIVEEYVDRAIAAAVTVFVKATRGGRITAMRSRAISKPVCLHKIKLWAEVTTDLCGITVLEWVGQVVSCRHRDSVECCEAATA